jgi:dihydrolipoamide dehydrogenase
MQKHYEVIVIGAGPAGYVAAIRCAQLGLQTACIDDWIDDRGEASPGGTCLNAGCIPSKALLETSEFYADLLSASAHPGINVEGIELDLMQIQREKKRIVNELTGGIATLFKANGVSSIPGRAQLLPGMQVAVSQNNSAATQKLSATHIIIATGSRPAEIAAAEMDGTLIVDSAGALAFDSVPERLAIIGAGVIGLEMGSVWRRFGSEVTLLEAQDTFLPAADRDVAPLALAQFREQGLDIRIGTCVTETQRHESSVRLSFSEAGKTGQLDVDRLVVAVGRRPNTDSLLPAESGLQLDEGGFIHVDEHLMTNLPNVYAIGDVIRGPMLAHKGFAEGKAVAECIAGRQGRVNYATIPSIIYTEPEIAWAGQTEQSLSQAGVPYRIGKFPFSASGRARAMQKTAGMVKILAEANTDEILGVHMIGAHASELIAEAVLAMEYRATAEDLALTIHGHPTLAEALHEAALAVNGEAVHIVNRSLQPTSRSL